jgi:hypothetical protein
MKCKQKLLLFSISIFQLLSVSLSAAKISELTASDGTVADTDELVINDYSESPATRRIDASQLKTYFATSGIAEGDIDTFAELDAIVADASLIQVGDAPVLDATNFTNLPGGGDLSQTDIDTFAELDAIVADATLIQAAEVDGYFDDPSDNASFAASTWKTRLGLNTGDSPEFAALTVDSDIGIGSGVITFSSGQVISLENQLLIDANDTGDEQLIWTGSGIRLNTGATVNTIETTLTDDDTHLPTSGAVFDYAATAAQGALSETAVQPADDPVATFDMPVTFIVACSDETSDLEAGTAVATFRAPFAFTLTGVRASVGTAPVGSTIEVDINEAGSTVLSTALSIDASEKTSETAATPAVISDNAIAADAELTIDLDQIGSSTAGAGLKVTLIGTR